MLHWILHSPTGFTVLLMIGFMIIIAIYILPVLLAWSLKSPFFLGITTLDLLLGWTIIGWIVALVWALVSGNGELFDEENP
ncbi:superinfection immunity protein [Acidithiobacillus sp. HP-6]|uniref:superinfection immunity protein n=1 Tax=unclassified Acidithiobacillus TaxID=2614800 RepID=UPI001879C39F|nr:MULTISPECIES: superinfection immunity protein [unclassified Acidithiobacillus]MBE7561427.1 superinfection immunity protein [Acidithiobacillus sp. HP-6]MBE7570071.1 superinfection immunity protein [Acidithiobacillus sp. HP-2]